MASQNYTTSFTVAQSPAQVFAAITNPRAWWGEGITGETAKLGGSFVYRHGPIHVSTQTLTTLVPGKKVVWKISKSHLNFVEKGDEWDGTEAIFDITKKGAKTELTIMHSGLVPAFECFKHCSAGWNYYLRDSLKPFIETGTGQPDPKSKAAA